MKLFGDLEHKQAMRKLLTKAKIVVIVVTALGSAGVLYAESRAPSDRHILLQNNSQSHSVKTQAAYAANQRVIMYATSWCPVCEQARRHFRYNNVQYVEYNIEDNPGARERWRKLGGRGVPLIVVGDQLMSGFDAQRFNRLYQR